MPEPEQEGSTKAIKKLAVSLLKSVLRKSPCLQSINASAKPYSCTRYYNNSKRRLFFSKATTFALPSKYTAIYIVLFPGAAQVSRIVKLLGNAEIFLLK
jgi:hypothetical protein